MTSLMKTDVVLAPAWSPGTVIDCPFGMALASRSGSGERVCRPRLQLRVLER